MDRFRTQVVGMDIDRGAIKAVQLAKAGGSYTLQHVGYHRLAPGAIEEGEVADHDLLTSEIREFWSSHSFKGTSVSLGLANQGVVVRLLDFPRMSPEDLKSAIGYEAQDHIPMPLEEAVMDYVSLGPVEEGSDLDRILIVAAGREMVGRYTSAIRAAGLRPVGIDVKALSLVRSTLPDAFFDEGDILLLDIGSELSNLVVCQGGNPMFTRTVPGGSGYFARMVAEYAGLPEDEAEDLLTRSKVMLEDPQELEESQSYAQNDGGAEDETDPSLDREFRRNVRRGIEVAADNLAEDVQGSIEYHYSQPGAREVSQVFVSGEGALVAGLESHLGELLQLPTSRGNPLQKLAGNKSNVSEEQLEVMEPVLAVALGLALEDE